jgi:hypothetical protein
MTGWQEDYQPVEDRLREFWLRYPGGRITTTLIQHADEDYIVQAFVYRGDELRDTPPMATGLAHDSRALLPSNMAASALEVCETSAIGRALANCGFAPKGKRPSREEMTKTSAASTWSGAVEPAAPKGTKAGPPAAAGASLDGGGDVAAAHGEGVNATDGGSPPPSDVLARLLEVVGGSEVKAINAVNKAVGGAYRKADLETLTPDEYAAGLAAVSMGGNHE